MTKRHRRRPPVLLLALMAAAGPATAATTEPTTGPATGPTTAPAVWPPPMMTSATPPDAAAAGEVAALVDRLSDDDPDVRERATEDLAHQDFTRLSLVEAAAGRGDLPPEAAGRLARLLPDLRRRAARVRRVLDVRNAGGPWDERLARADYDAGGHTDARWDDAARAFLLLAIRRRFVWGPARDAVTAEARRQLQLAVDAGCDDPVVLACGGLLAADTDGTPAADVQGWFDRADRAVTDRTPPWYRVIIDGRVLRARSAGFRYQAGEAATVAMRARVDRMALEVRQVVRTRGIPADRAADAIENLRRAGEAYDLQVGSLCHWNADDLAGRHPNDPAALYARGLTYVRWAWEAGDHQAEDADPVKATKDFKARLDLATKLLTHAWQVDPTDPGPPTEMLAVELARDEGRAVMETWFARAMAADPDHFDACQAKLKYLGPNAHGSAADALAFGRECVAGRNWRARLPIMLVDAHFAVADASGDPAAYWLDPGVWADVTNVYSAHLRQYPGDDDLRGYYAKVAYKCHQWRVLRDQLKLLGDGLAPAGFGDATADDLADARSRAAALADLPDEQGR